MQELNGPEVLSRKQLKSVLGGIDPIVTTTAGRCKRAPQTCTLDGDTGVCEQNSKDQCICRTESASLADPDCVRMAS